MLRRLNKTLCARICCWAVLTVTVAGADWSPDFLSHTKALSCRPGDLKTNVTFLHATRSGHFTKLGKAADIEVCILLCCEIDKCEAAFMARKNCYAVTCFSEHHCTTAPARNNKWQPMISFVQRLQSNKALTKNKEEFAQGPGSTSAKTLKSENDMPNKPLLKKHQDSKLHGEDTREKKVLIHVKDNNDSVELNALQGKPSAQYENYHQKNPRSVHYSLVSAAVATCLVAFLLSGFAVVAARIRSRREVTDPEKTRNPQYSEVPTEE